MERKIYDKSKIALRLRSSRDKIIVVIFKKVFVELAGVGAIDKALSFFSDTK